MTKSHNDVIAEAQEEWRLKKSDRDWDGWVRIGRALLLGRHQAMAEAQTNDPIGKRYNHAFGRWLRDNDFADMDKSDRSRLMDCLDHLEDIRKWRSTLTTNQRQQWNHPTTVWRRYIK